MLGWCTGCYGGVVRVRVVYCVLWRCIVCNGGALYVMAVY